MIIGLTKKGQELHTEALQIPGKFANRLLSGDLDVADLVAMKEKLTRLIKTLSQEV